MTHGEAWYKWKCRVNSFSCRFDEVDRSMKLPKRMTRRSASTYYNIKCRKAFEKLGFKYKVTTDFDKKIKMYCLSVRASTNKMLKREVNKIQRILNVA